MNPKVVIQAGGKGSRLYPYTQVLPKPLMPIGGIPILEIVIRQLAHYRDRTPLCHYTTGGTLVFMWWPAVCKHRRA